MPPPEVFLDGESVEFSGPPPEDVAGLIAALDAPLAQAGRVLAAVTVDGRDAAEAAGRVEYAAAQRVDVATVPLAQAIAQVAAENAQTIARVRLAADELANAVLQVSWAQAQPRCATAGQEMAAAVRDFAGLARHVEGGEQVLGAVLAAMDAWTAAVEQRDAAEVSLRLHRSVIPALQTVENVLARSRGEGAP